MRSSELLKAAALLALSGCAGDGNGAAAGIPTCEVIHPSAALPDVLDESSGVAFGRGDAGVLWTHNDSGGEPYLYAVRPDGRLVATVEVAGARNRDWEDIDAGPCDEGDCLYLADIGDNRAVREEVVIYRVPEPPARDGETEPAERFPVRYPDGPRDAEALFTLPDGGVYIISKGRTSDVALYRHPGALQGGETVELERVTTLSGPGADLAGQVTGAGASPDGRWVAVRTYSALSIYRTADLLAGRPAASVVDIGPLGEPQGEAVAIDDGLEVVLTSEAAGLASSGSITVIRCDVDPGEPGS